MRYDITLEETVVIDMPTNEFCHEETTNFRSKEKDAAEKVMPCIIGYMLEVFNGLTGYPLETQMTIDPVDAGLAKEGKKSDADLGQTYAYTDLKQTTFRAQTMDKSI